MSPDFFIVPRNAIAAYVWCNHQVWLKETRRDGQPHKDNSMRNIAQKYLNDYKERWDDLLGSPDSINYLFPNWFLDWANKVGLPPNHPGVVKG